MHAAGDGATAHSAGGGQSERYTSRYAKSPIRDREKQNKAKQSNEKPPQGAPGRKDENKERQEPTQLRNRPVTQIPISALSTPHLGLIIQNNREKVPKSNIRPIRRNEMKLYVFRCL